MSKTKVFDYGMIELFSRNFPTTIYCTCSNMPGFHFIGDKNSWPKKATRKNIHKKVEYRTGLRFILIGEIAEWFKMCQSFFLHSSGGLVALQRFGCLRFFSKFKMPEMVKTAGCLSAASFRRSMEGILEFSKIGQAESCKAIRPERVA